MILTIKALRVFVHVGVHPWEQRIRQPLLIDITTTIGQENKHDNIDNTINYETLCQKVSEFISSTSFKLIETVANETAAFIIKTFHVSEVTVTICKPFAVKQTSGVSVQVQHQRDKDTHST